MRRVSTISGCRTSCVLKGFSPDTLKLLEASEFGNTDCIVTITAYRDGKQIGTLNTELTLHTAYLWPKEVQ